MKRVNNNYHITVEAIAGWPTYDPASGTATFTMRTSNVGEGVAFEGPWLATLPPELDVQTPQVDAAITEPAVPASVEAGETVLIGVTVANTPTGLDPASGQVIGEAREAAGELIASFLGEFSDLAVGASTQFTFDRLATVTAAGDTDLSNNTATAATQVVSRERSRRGD